MRYCYVFLFFLAMAGCQPKTPDKNQWVFFVKQEGKPDVEIGAIPEHVSSPVTLKKDIGAIHIAVQLQPKKDAVGFTATASVDSGTNHLYFSVARKYVDAVPYNFNGKVEHAEIYRQSPHDVNAWIVKDIAMQAIPVVALQHDSIYDIAICNSPALYDNFTSQAFYVNEKRVALSSGDDGGSPGLHPDTSKHFDHAYNTEKTQVMSLGKICSHYPEVTKNQPHVFEGVVFSAKANSLQALRKAINQRSADQFSNTAFNDYFGALAFTTAWMNLRKNETGKSKYWVVPSVEYANTQYGRDAFWISTMLPPEMAAECLKNELDSVNHYAEYPLTTILWAYRSHKQGNDIDMAKVQTYVNSVENHAREGYFYSFDENDGRLDFQYWGDVIAFEKDDVVTYNQGLFALSLFAAKAMGLDVKTDPEKAMQLYRNMFNEKLGFYPISKKKNDITGPDPLVPDMLAKLYFGTSVLSDESVNSHYRFMCSKMKTPFGFKVIGQQDGSYLTNAQYDIKGYTAQVNREQMKDGQYFRGGSFYLYDAFFLIDAYLHNIPGAERELIWRTSLDFKAGATTYECMNTLTGEPWKPNMGWNVAVCACWRQLMNEGKADDKFFKHIDSLTNNQIQ